MAKTKAEKIERITTEIEQLEAQKKKLLQEQKIQERNARTKRLCKRMGLFESMLPAIISLTDEQFQSFLEKTVTTEHSRRILDGLTVQNAAAAAQESARTAAQGNTTPTAIPAFMEQDEDTDESEDEGNDTRERG